MEIYEASHDNDEFIFLDDETITRAAQHGVLTRKISLARGYQERHGFGHAGTLAAKLRSQALGALSEAALRRAFGFDPLDLVMDNFKEPDMPGNIECRLIGVDWYGLRIYPDTPDSRRVIGAVIEKGMERKPPWRLPGWFISADAKRREWQIAPNGGPPFYAVPQKYLRHNEELRKVLRSEGIYCHSFWVSEKIRP